MLFKRKYYICSVCGFDRLLGPLYKNGIPDYSLICTCCAFQPGYDDLDQGYTLDTYRAEWLANGAEWFMKKEQPKNWDLKAQLKNIGIEL